VRRVQRELRVRVGGTVCWYLAHTTHDAYTQALLIIERQRPDYVDEGDRLPAVDDARRLSVQLPDVPERPAANYRRLSCLDQVGFVWLLHGRAVVGLTTDTAIVTTPSGSRLIHRGASVRNLVSTFKKCRLLNKAFKLPASWTQPEQVPRSPARSAQPPKRAH
jgi:hypothetical protein